MPDRELKFTPLDLKRVEPDGTFAGYASLFNREDMGHDIVLPGAFRDSLRQRGAAGIKMLFQHKPDEPIGVWESLKEDARGLYAKGRLMLDVARAREVLALMRAGALDGLSIGFRAVTGNRDAKTGIRRLAKVDLWEISVVTFPLLPEARVAHVKSARTVASSPRIAAATRRMRASLSPRIADLSTRSNSAGRVGCRGRNVVQSGDSRTARWTVDQCNAAYRPIAPYACSPRVHAPLAPHTDRHTHHLTTHHLTRAKEPRQCTTTPLDTAFDDFMRAFEAFKETNDERLSQLERRTSADVVTTDKVDRLNRALDETKRVVDDLALKSARPHLGGPAPTHPAPAHSSSTRPPSTPTSARATPPRLRDLESKALSVGTDPDGGYLVPDELERAVNRAVRNVSPIRAIAGIRQVSGSVYKKPFAITGADTGWVAETAARPETDTPTLAELAFPTMELYAMPAATSALLDDTAVNIDEWIAEEVRDSFAQQEGTAFVTGNGTAKPKGFLDYTKVANASWSWGNIGFITTGVGRRLPGHQPGRQADRPRLRGEIRLPRQRHLRLQPRHPGGDPQDEGRRRQLPLAARGQGRRRLHADGLSGRRVRGHAEHRHRQLLGGLRRLPPRLSDRRPRRHPRAARSLQLQALRAVLHHQARRRRRAGLRRHQAPQVRASERGFAEARAPPPRPRATRAGPHFAPCPPPHGAVPLAPLVCPVPKEPPCPSSSPPAPPSSPSRSPRPRPTCASTAPPRTR